MRVALRFEMEHDSCKEGQNYDSFEQFVAHCKELRDGGFLVEEEKNEETGGPGFEESEEQTLERDERHGLVVEQHEEREENYILEEVDGVVSTEDLEGSEERSQVVNRFHLL